MIRADASTQIGSGHIMRCLALAQAWQSGGRRVIFLMAMEAPILEERLKSEGMEVAHLTVQPGGVGDAVKTAGLAQEVGAAWVVVDGYRFDAGYQRAIKDLGVRLLFIDDNGQADHYYADIVVNQNIHAHAGLYTNREPYTQLLLGTRYTLLRHEFSGWRRWKRQIPEAARKVLVTLGGGDADNVTLKVIRALNQVDIQDIEVAVIVGPSNPHMAALRKAVARSPFTVHLLPSVENMPEFMAWADVAISAGGSTSWELAFMGLPSLVFILADNQLPAVERLHTQGVALNLGCHQRLSCAEISHAIKRLLMTSGIRQEMASRGRELVDGEGVDRVIMQMKKMTLRFRKVCEKDCRLLWEWANERDVRSVSFRSETVPWEEHVQWLKSNLRDPNCIFHIVSNEEGTPIGQVRYDISGNEAVISISIDRKFRGRGYGSVTILLSSQEVFDTSDVRIIHAYVKQSNGFSARAFLKAGFKDMGTKAIHGHRAMAFALTKDAMV